MVAPVEVEGAGGEAYLIIEAVEAVPGARNSRRLLSVLQLTTSSRANERFICLAPVWRAASG